MRRKRFRRTLSSFMATCFLLSQALPLLAAPPIRRPLRNPPTRSPIKHLIVVIGENRSFDNLFATYIPPDPNQKVMNLLRLGLRLGFKPEERTARHLASTLENRVWMRLDPVQQ